MSCGLFCCLKKRRKTVSVPMAYIGVILIWSTTPLGIKWSGEEVGFIFGVTARMSIGVFVCLALVALLSRRVEWHKQALSSYIAAGLGIWSTMTCVYWGAQHVSSGLISVLFGLMPVVTGILASIWLNEHVFTRFRVIGMILGLSGLVIIFRGYIDAEDQALWAIAMILAGMLFQSMSAVWVKKISSQMHPIEMTSGALLVALPLFVITYSLSGQTLPDAVPQRALWSIVYLGIFGSALGFILYFYLVKSVEANKVALITLITPVLALMIGQWMNGEVISMYEWLGASVILLGLASYQWGDRLLIRRAIQ